MTSQCDYMTYHRLKKQVEDDLDATMDNIRFIKLRELYQRCFPTKEQAIEEVQAFYDAEEITP